ncbi:hypothetical protein GGR57DRAFT_236219 [Xylariaceae sp. FL1272]|nr:hypothetical protein GGR57DRAFT_236219 [Xylariaceae sp. FL1272]
MANPHPIPRPVEEHAFHPKDAVKSGLVGMATGAGAGFMLSAVQNSLSKRNVGTWGVFTKTGSTIGYFTAVSAIYGFATDASANLREKDDSINHGIGAFLGGAVLGLRAGRMPQVLGYGAAFAVVMTAFDYTGGNLVGKRTEVPEMDEYERKEYLRNNRRRPIEETIMELGEGRGIEPPGYEERRRERLKAKYGVDIKPVSALAE